MHPNVLSLAVPFFFVAILAEAFVDARRKRGLYRFGTAIADLDVGIASRVFEALLQGLVALAYIGVYRHRLFSYEEGSPWPWIVSILGIDFLYYWWHRLSHVVNVFWAVHAVHHQSEDFNFAVALRQPAFSPLTIIPFHAPLALLGIEPWIYGTCYAINLIYQFWIHTEFPGRLGVLEWVLNSPSSHRVHHGINPRYLDRNYGGILIVWDRLFGTYQQEEETPVYGVTHPLRSHNPIWANVAPFVEIAARARAAPSFWDKVRTLFAHPATGPGRPRSNETRSTMRPVPTAGVVKYVPRLARDGIAYVTAHFVVLALAGGAFMSLAEGARIGAVLLPGLLLLASVAALGAWTEGQSWALPLDVGRQVAAALWISWFVSARFGVAVGTAAGAAVALFGLATLIIARPWRVFSQTPTEVRERVGV